ncbi:hypothetical protein D1953_08400 [Peribacillus asahii]|uniref:Uncharacterized protein n=1 Tax=Peribacillus asahii TaxID=228899 RepID=A0A398BGF9_9BACI|nr:hypothetical protein D1953_08400 [Peribacillus asahii]
MNIYSIGHNFFNYLGLWIRNDRKGKTTPIQISVFGESESDPKTLLMKASQLSGLITILQV